MPDGSEITIETKEDRILIKTWYEQHPDYDQKPQLQFPVDIKYKDGLVKTISSQEELKLAYASWVQEGPDKAKMVLISDGEFHVNPKIVALVKNEYETEERKLSLIQIGARASGL